MPFRIAQKFLKAILSLVLVGAMVSATACQRERAPQILSRSQNETRPNVLIFVVDALGHELSPYGDKTVPTPNIDRLAREGVTYTNAYAASGSHGAAWASLITGVHPQTLGVVQDWTDGRGWTVAPQPEVKAFPELLRQKGWHTFRVGPSSDPFGGVGGLWDLNERSFEAAWPEADIPQPFLGVVEVSTLPPEEASATKPQKKGFLEGLFQKEEKAPAPPAIDAAKLAVPPYLPDTPALRQAMKARYERIAAIDAQIGEAIARLEKAGALDDTVIILTARTGPPWPRGERTLYDSGVRVPLIVRHPDGRAKGTTSRALFSGVDLAPSVLKLVGMQPMAWMHGRDRLSAKPEAPWPFVFSIQNRVGAVFERARAVRDGRYLFIRNESPETRLFDLARRGAFYDAVAGQGGTPSLGPNQTTPRAEVELYDIVADPHQLKNLAADAGRLSEVQRMAAALSAFRSVTPDLSTSTTQELRDRYRPAGVTPVTAPPLLRLVRGRVTMEALTPGSSIQWREDEKKPWKLYRGPVAPPKNGKLEARATRYGFIDSPVQMFDAKKNGVTTKK